MLKWPGALRHPALTVPSGYSTIVFSCSDRCFRYGRSVTVDPSACDFYDDGNRVCVGQCDFASVTKRIVRETIEQVIGTVLKDGRAAADGWRQS